MLVADTYLAGGGVYGGGEPAGQLGSVGGREALLLSLVWLPPNAILP